jgi:hypothetical protein
MSDDLRPAQGFVIAFALSVLIWGLIGWLLFL